MRTWRRPRSSPLKLSPKPSSNQTVKVAAAGVALLFVAGCSVADAAPVATVTVLAAGDLGDCGRSTDNATANLLDGTPHAAVLTLGDNAYPSGTLAQYRDCYGPTWGRHLSDTRPAPGNHDYAASSTAAGYFGYFGTRAGVGYYSFNVGGWHVVSLNSERVTAAQVAWLKADLAASTVACTLAYWHTPRYDATGKGDDASVEPFWSALVADRAEVVLSSHAHNYQRFRPIRGIVQYVAGTGGGGSPLDPMRPDSRRAAGQGHTYGVLRLDLAAGSWSSRFLPVAGKTYADTGSGTCQT